MASVVPIRASPDGADHRFVLRADKRSRKAPSVLTLLTAQALRVAVRVGERGLALGYTEIKHGFHQGCSRTEGRAFTLARLRRKDLKRDRFVEEVTQQVAFFAVHRKRFIGGGIAVVVLIVAAVSYSAYARGRHAASQAALQEAVDYYHGVVTDEDLPGVKTFTSESERIDAVTKALDAIALDYSGTIAAGGAAFYSGLLDRDEGNVAEARSHFEQALNGKGSEYPGLARLALGGLLLAEGDSEGARKHFQWVVEHPSRTVSKDRASIEVARTLIENDPQQAREILDAIQAENGPASSLAATLMETIAEGS